MYPEKTVKDLVKKYQQYRRLQAKIIKLRNDGLNKPEKKNNPKMFAHLANVAQLLKDMDVLTAQLDVSARRGKMMPVEGNKELIN